MARDFAPFHVPDIDHHREEVLFDPGEEGLHHPGDRFFGIFVLPANGLLKPLQMLGKELLVPLGQVGGSQQP